MREHKRYMRRALRLALRAEGMTSPNPLVGAVIVKDGKVVGEGYHRRCGLPHAEAAALKCAGARTKGATLYVTLEPCDHFGRTPPCTDIIIKSGIAKVVIGMKDPNPINNGRGIKKLNRYGIKTVVGILEEDAMALNRPYIKYITTKMPYLTVKTAQSLDGKIATRTGDSRWITSKRARQYVQRLRAKVDAVMVGVNTVIKDDPILLSKVNRAKQPVRIIVDSRLKTPLDAKIFSTSRRSPIIIATKKKPSRARIKHYEAKGARILFLKSKDGRVDLRHLFRVLAEMEIMHILSEGGGELIAGLIKERLVDRFLFFIAPKIIGGRRAPTPVEGKGIDKLKDAVVLDDIKIRRFGEDVLIDAEANRCLRE